MNFVHLGPSGNTFWLKLCACGKLSIASRSGFTHQYRTSFHLVVQVCFLKAFQNSQFQSHRQDHRWTVDKEAVDCRVYVDVL